jgi:hypothetical protein
MEQIILGLLIQVVFLCAVLLAFFIGRKTALKSSYEKPKVDEKERQRILEFDQHFKALFSYDVSTALQRKKVTDE